MTGTTILISFFLVYFIIGAGMLLFTLRRLHSRQPTISGNDDSQAVDRMTKQVNATEKNMQIFDDGDDFDHTLYDNDTVMNAIKEKIHNHPEFKLDIHFNFQHENLAITKLAKEFKNNITIKYNNHISKSNITKRDWIEWHFRISDKGKYCHLSAGSSERKLKTFRPRFYEAIHPEINECIKRFKLQSQEQFN